MGYCCTCSSSSRTRRMPRFTCVCAAVAVATVVGMILLVDLVALSGPFPHTVPSSSSRSIISNRLEALGNPRLMLKELPNTLSTIQRSAGLKLLEYETNGINNEIAFTDAQFAETVEEQYNKIIASQKWLRQRVDWEEHSLQKAPEITFDTGSQDLTVTLFSAPPAFTGSESDRNRQALLSWLHLSPRPHVVLLGNHSSLHRVADEFPGLVTVEPNIDYTFTGLPLFHSMVARANAVATNITVLVPPDVMLLQDFMPGLRKLAATFTDWALVAQRLQISDLPFRFVHKGGGIVFLEHSVTGESKIDREMASFVRTSGKLALLEGVNVWAWTVAADAPLFAAAPMPSFTYGAGYHDQWMARALVQGSRIVVDATDALVGFHVRGPQVYQAVGDDNDVDMGAAGETSSSSMQTQTTTATPTPTPTPTTMTTPFWNMAGMECHNIANLYLYRKHRDIAAEEKALLSGGWKLIGCPEPSMIKLCISETYSAANPCHCENIFSRPVSGTRYSETFLEKEARLRLEVIDIPALGTSAEYNFHSLAQVLPQVADATSKNVVLVGVTSAYKDMLWSFMCRARALGVTNVLVAAFDTSVYKSALVRGLPVFYAGSSPTTEDGDHVMKRAAAPAGTCEEVAKITDHRHCSHQVVETKLKLQVVLQVLQKGFHVLWSDVDVVWFRNPLPLVTTFKSGTQLVVMESEEPHTQDQPANGGGRVSAGFFYAQAENATIMTFKDLVRDAGDSRNQPEQLLSSQVLCGRGVQRRRVGVTECTAPSTGLRTSFLNRRTFSNGIVNGYWWHQNVTHVAASTGVYVLHNNWIHGNSKDDKVRRQKVKRVWFYNDAARMCVHPWQQQQQQQRHGNNVTHDHSNIGDHTHVDTES